MNDDCLRVGRFSKRLGSVIVHKLIDLILEHGFVAVNVRAQLLCQRRCVRCENARKLLPSGELQNLVLHKVHTGNVLFRIQIGARGHHEGVQNLIDSFRKLIISVRGKKSSDKFNQRLAQISPDWTFKELQKLKNDDKLRVNLNFWLVSGVEVQSHADTFSVRVFDNET